MLGEQTKEQYVEERMERFRMTAQCQCAAHYVEAQRRAMYDWEAMKATEKFFAGPDGMKVKKSFARLVKRLNKQAQKAIECQDEG